MTLSRFFLWFSFACVLAWLAGSLVREHFALACTAFIVLALIMGYLHEQKG